MRAHEGGIKLVCTDSARQMEPASARVPRDRSGGLAPFLKTRDSGAAWRAAAAAGAPRAPAAHTCQCSVHTRENAGVHRAAAQHIRRTLLSSAHSETGHLTVFPHRPLMTFVFAQSFPPFPHSSPPFSQLGRHLSAPSSVVIFPAVFRKSWKRVP